MSPPEPSSTAPSGSGGAIQAVTHGSARALTVADQRAVRRHNLAAVLRLIAGDGPRSRARIAEITGLNRSTVSSLVAELVDRGLLCDASEPETPGAVGRPAVLVQLDGDGVVGLGLEVNVDYLAVCAVDLSGRVRFRAFRRSENRGVPAHRTLERLVAMVREALDALDALALRPVGATVGLPGLVDISRGELFVAPNLGWEHVAVAQVLTEQLDRPSLRVRVDNEGNLGALAEQWEGSCRDVADFVYVSGDIGVGAGIVLGGELFRGASGFSGEFGHFAVDPDGARCRCGSRGCLETVVGQEALLRLSGVDPSTAATTTDPAAPVRQLAARARAGDELVLGVLEAAGSWLGLALSGVANLMNPATVVLGGFLAPLGPWLQQPVREEIHRRVLSSTWSPVHVEISALGPDAAIRGGAALSLREVLDDPGAVAPR